MSGDATEPARLMWKDFPRWVRICMLISTLLNIFIMVLSFLAAMGTAQGRWVGVVLIVCIVATVSLTIINWRWRRRAQRRR